MPSITWMISYSVGSGWLQTMQLLEDFYAVNAESHIQLTKQQRHRNQGFLVWDAKLYSLPVTSTLLEVNWLTNKLLEDHIL